ncbi:hypothetical protein [Mangrovicoccus sp. HB161399]|uniref:hypothetical protein n=1 Tax=Mangrovicoccus sp. HB161399 TaxID=2720392 RepID=UPI001554274E|nr:hypothetical protein [Mangrovicoccus sp. HB161399]
MRVAIRSIGTATPSRAASIALGLGVPVQAVMETLYRAPRILVDGLAPETADRMAELLGDLGCEVAVEPEDMAPPGEEPLYDVALHINDTARYGAVTEALAEFLGCDAAQAARAILQPPGVVLGQVSAATVEALCRRLGEGAELSVSDPQAARYDLFLGACDPTVRARVLGELRRRGREPLAGAGCLLSGLSRSEADAIWAALGRIGALRIVNSDFLRYDIVLTGGTDTPAAREVLEAYARIPGHIVPELFGALPIAAMEAVPQADMPAALERLAAAGLSVRADLVTFLHLGVELVSARRGVDPGRVLQRLGIETGGRVAVPGRLPFAMPELQARLVRDALAGAGIEAALYEPEGA